MKKILIFVLVIMAACTNDINSENIITFCVSIVRPDGVLLPFTVYDSGKWSNPWPGTFRRRAPIDSTITSLTDIPKSWYTPLPEIPLEWYIRKLNGDSTVVRISKPVCVKTHCVKKWGLLSDYSLKITDFPQHLLNIEGIALSTNILTQRPFAIKEESNEWKELFRFVALLFHREEQEAGHPLPKIERAKADPTLTKLFRNESAHGGAFIYYFEAKKHYASINERSLHSTSFLKGWILRDSTGKITLLMKGFKFTPFRTMYIRRGNPLGIIVINGKMFWILQHRGYEGEMYLVFEVSGSRIKQIIEVHGGGC